MYSTEWETQNKQKPTNHNRPQFNTVFLVDHSHLKQKVNWKKEKQKKTLKIKTNCDQLS